MPFDEESRGVHLKPVYFHPVASSGTLANMRHRLAGLIVLFLWIACIRPDPAAAWSIKEHIQLTRMAAERLMADPSTPPAMKEWLKAANPLALDENGEHAYLVSKHVGLIPRGVDGLPYWATLPDLNGMTEPLGSTIEPFGVHEKHLHYIDLEYFNPDADKRSYLHDLSHKPRLQDIPRDMSDPRWKRAGMLPWRVEQAYAQLVLNLKQGRLDDKPGRYPRDEHACKWAGMLAHYVEDNTQPHHATADFQSRAYFAKAAGFRSPNIHWDVEGRLVDDEKDDYLPLREEYWGLLVKALAEPQDSVQIKDQWQGSLEVSLGSYDALPLIGTAAMASYKQGGTPEMPAGHFSDQFDADAFFHAKGMYRGREMTVLEMKAIQQAWAVQRVARLWRQAWGK